MSNERSPRDVCSITIGISGLMQAPSIPGGGGSVAGGPQLRLLLGSFLVGRPDRVPGLRDVHRDRLHLGGHAVERGAEADVLAQVLVAAGVPELVDHVVGIFARLFSLDRKSTRLNSSHSQISYAVFCLKK